MARNKISDLRDHLFETIEALKDPDRPMELERARTISAVAQTMGIIYVSTHVIENTRNRVCKK